MPRSPAPLVLAATTALALSTASCISATAFTSTAIETQRTRFMLVGLMTAAEGGTLYALDGVNGDSADAHRLIVDTFVVDLALGLLVLVTHYHSPYHGAPAEPGPVAPPPTPAGPTGGYSCVSYYNHAAFSTSTFCSQDCPGYVDGMHELRDAGLATDFTSCVAVPSVWCHGTGNWVSCVPTRAACELNLKATTSAGSSEVCEEQH